MSAVILTGLIITWKLIEEFEICLCESVASNFILEHLDQKLYLPRCLKDNK